jgi:hypothetical protein
MATGKVDSVLPLVYNGIAIEVKQHRINSTDIYRVIFADNRPPLIMTIAEKKSGKAFWTSIPEGRHEEAEDIACLVNEHFLLL